MKKYCPWCGEEITCYWWCNNCKNTCDNLKWSRNFVDSMDKSRKKDGIIIYTLIFIFLITGIVIYFFGK